MPCPDAHYTLELINHETGERLKIELIGSALPRSAQLPHSGSPREIEMAKYYVYALRSLADRQFYVGLTRNLPARVRSALTRGKAAFFRPVGTQA